MPLLMAAFPVEIAVDDPSRLPLWRVMFSVARLFFGPVSRPEGLDRFVDRALLRAGCGGESR